ncbi:NAD(P)H-quinone oxidoreductase [Bradyrhizobium sp. AUGA SZCCT0240]|nr:NAD(P)H-quinone oxidoreductase [Bradyrhizobium sp. AUGA SZCCT0240]MBR1252284.1 NAD(P)H-quinone oxidoreductase [Bradyrhizobium sp. AUGA SZCCT0240]
MIAIAAMAAGGPEVLVPEERPVPVPGPHEILIKVSAAGLNRGDVVQRRGLYPPPPGASDIFGLEVAGEVIAKGPKVTRFRPGDKVMSLVAGGGYAQYCVAHEAHTFAIPSRLNMVTAASVPETFMTVWHNVFQRGSLLAGETLLVHGGSSGIGVTAIQLAKTFDAKVIATAGSAEKCDICRQLGADVAINYKTSDFVEEVHAATGGIGAHVILDMVGGAYIGRNFAAASVEGRIVQIGFMDTSLVTANFSLLMTKRLLYTGSTLRARSAEDKARLAHAVETNAIPLLNQGRYQPIIDRTFPLEQAADAHRRMESGQHIGKIVLTT